MFHCCMPCGLNRLANSKLISQSDLHSPTWTLFLRPANGAHQARILSFSANVAAGSTKSVNAIVVGL